MPDEITASESVADVARVAFKAPPFWRANPEVWFIQLESQFVVSGISADDTKYHCVVSALDGDVLTLISDIIRQPPTDNKYETIKNRIIANYADSETARLKMLLKDLELGDKRPSHLLRSMQDLAGNSISTEILRSLFLQRLPVSVQQILSVCMEKGEQNLSLLAEKADKILEVTQNSLTVNSINVTDDNSRFQKLEDEIRKLSETVTRLSRQQYRNKNKFSTRRQGSRSRSTQRTVAGPLCWYHYKFGTKANKCIPPCNYAQNSEN
nr:uncharacterized protein LOC122269874 [Parasteatoda tepidariorum]